MFWLFNFKNKAINQESGNMSFRRINMYPGFQSVTRT